MNSQHFDTLQVHAGRIKSGSNGPCATPIFQTSSFLFDNSDHAAQLFELKAPGHIYTRLSNPTTDVLEQRVAALEGGTAAVAVSSGQASQFLAIQNIAGSGDNIVSSSSLYGGSYNQFRISFAKLGIDFRFAQKGNIQNFERLIDSRTKAIFIETRGIILLSLKKMKMPCLQRWPVAISSTRVKNYLIDLMLTPTIL